MRTSRYNPSRPYGDNVGFGSGVISPFIKVMLIANAAVFLGQYFLPQITERFGLTPTLFFAQFPVLIYQVFTYMFLHGGLAHIFFNMFTLWMFGTEIEYAWGTRSFARFYLICGLAGGILSLAVFPHQESTIIGASGAIYGILAAYWLMFPDRLLYIYFLFPVKVKYAIPGMMLLGYFFSSGHIAHMAHLGGALCGLAYLKVDWRWLAVGQKFKDLRHKKQLAMLSKRRQKADEVMQRVDAILDKINEVGMENLTKSERKFLEEASSQLSKQRDPREK